MMIEEILPEKWRSAKTTPITEAEEPEKLWGIHLGTRENGEGEEDSSDGMVKYPLLIVRDLGEFMERVGIVYEFDEGIRGRKTWGTVRELLEWSRVSLYVSLLTWELGLFILLCDFIDDGFSVLLFWGFA